MYKKHKESNSFTIKAALKRILYQYCKHKMFGVLLFKSHFGCCANTPFSIISAITKYSDLSYDKILNHYLDEETKSPNELLPEKLGNILKRRWKEPCAR